jgi:hypothetical protein
MPVWLLPKAGVGTHPLRHLLTQIQGLGENGEAAKKPSDTWPVTLVKVSKRKSMNSRLAKTNPNHLIGIEPGEKAFGSEDALRWV